MTGNVDSAALMRKRAHSVTVPPGFDFVATAISHGWCVLAPFAWDRDASALSYRARLPGGRVTGVALTQPGGRDNRVRAEITSGAGSRAGLTTEDWRALRASLTRVLRLDDDLAPFYARCRDAGDPFSRAEEAGFGRLLRAPTLFEDLVKILATTNTTWSGTKAMVRNLVELAGTRGAFPTARQVARIAPSRLREEARWGYRADSLSAIARGVDDGTIELDRWESWRGPTEALADEIQSLPGIGPYATAHALSILGRYDRIGVDTVFRSFVRQRYFPRSRKMPTDDRMLAIYRPWGEWRSLAYWFDLWMDHQ